MVSTSTIGKTIVKPMVSTCIGLLPWCHEALSPISDPAGAAHAHVESDSGEVTANVESLCLAVELGITFW